MKFTTSVYFKQNLNQVWQTGRMFSDISLREKGGMGQMNYCNFPSSHVYSGLIHTTTLVEHQILCLALNHSKSLKQTQTWIK